MTPRLCVLYEDNHLLAVSKPAMLATMGVAAGEPSLWSLCREYLRQKYHKPGNVYLGVVSRLDSPVTGIVLFARTSKAAARLSRVYRERRVAKVYWALVSGRIAPASGQCVDWVLKDDRAARMRVVQEGQPGAQQARLSYRTLRSAGDCQLLEVVLQTGRKHQIRLQLAARGHPVLGDQKYGSRRRFPAGIALHARLLELVHPVRRTALRLVAPLPASWRREGWDEGPGGLEDP